MSHGIVKPIDKLFSIIDSGWHRLADVVETIDDTTIAPLLFEIVQGGMILDNGPKGTVEEMLASLRALLKTENLQPSGSPSEFVAKVVAKVRSETRMSNHQGLAADFRTCRPDLVENPETSGGLVPLHVPKNSYAPIDNRAVWEMTKRALKDVDAKVSCAGTLEAGRKFFVSVQLGQDGGKFKVNNDEFGANFNVITSHDGSFAVEAFDSMIRIICMNTLRWSREAASEMKFKIYHCQGAPAAMHNMGPLINRILLGRETFRNNMEFLASIPTTKEAVRLLLLGYFAADQELTTKKPVEKLAKNSFNMADEITVLFERGLGNKGQTLYDALNGATEYWTGGDGTGVKANEEVKAYKANFGQAMEHKSAFANLLLSGEDVIAQTIEKGREMDLAGVRERKTKGSKS